MAPRAASHPSRLPIAVVVRFVAILTIAAPNCALSIERGLDDAAARVYRAKPNRLSLSGHGQLGLGATLGADDERAPSRGEVGRLVQYVGRRFDNTVIVNTAVAIEPRGAVDTPDNRGGAVSAEFLYLDFPLLDEINVRAGLVLMPLGLVNERHAPTSYHTSMRPLTERTIIPSVWRQVGIGLYGSLPAGFHYRTYMTGGLDAAGFDRTGVAGGRQQGGPFTWEDRGLALRLDWHHWPAVELGASYYIGGADQDPRRSQAARVRHSIASGHAIFRYAHAELRFLYAEGQLRGDPRRYQPSVPDDAVEWWPKTQRGFYLEAAWDLLPLFAHRPKMQLAPVARFERVNLHTELMRHRRPDSALDTETLTVGVDFRPHRQVVIKAEFSARASAAPDDPTRREARLGAGFTY